MGLFVINNQEFEVSYDKEELKEFREKVIENASIIRHKKYTAHHSPFYNKKGTEPIRIVNLKKEFAFEDEFGLDCFYYEFDEYVYPYLIVLIDRLLCDDLSALKDIYCPDMSKELTPYDYEANHILEQLHLNSTNIDDKIKLTEQLRELYVNSKNDDKYGTMIIQYYFELMSMIDLKKKKILCRELK